MEDFKELKGKSVKELEVILAEDRELLRDLNFKDANRQLNDVRQIRKVKQKIARILTVLNSQKDEKRD